MVFVNAYLAYRKAQKDTPPIREMYQKVYF